MGEFRFINVDQVREQWWASADTVINPCILCKVRAFLQ